MTLVFLNRANALGAGIDKASLPTGAKTDKQEVIDAANAAYAAYKKPQYLYKPNEVVINYSRQQKGTYYVDFPTPWSLYFWNNNMLGQLSDGYWENSRQWEPYWKFAFSLKPRYNPTPVGVENDYDGPNPGLVAKYAFYKDSQYIKFGKIYQLNNIKFLPLLDDYKIDGDMFSIKTIKDMKQVEGIAKEFGITIEDMLVILGCPELPKQKCQRIINAAHKEIKSLKIVH